MQQSKARIIADGVLAGLVGAAVIAAWFLIVDAAKGQPLATPALLAAAMLHGAREPIVLTHTAWLLVAEYTVVHFLAFAVIGAVGALLIDASERHPELFGPLFIFTIAFEVFFIMLLMVLGPAAAATLPWWKVMIGNLMATGAMLAIFFWRQPMLAENLLGPWIDVAREGIVAGIIGGVIVALWFLVYDVASGHPFHTPALLGAIIFNGMQQPEGFAVTTALVLAYTALHFFAFISFGIAASVLMAAAVHEPLVALGVLVLFVWFELSFVAFVTFLDQQAVQEIGWWNVIGGNVTALAAIVTYFERAHPGTLPRLFDRWVSLRDEAAQQHAGAGGRPAASHRA